MRSVLVVMLTAGAVILAGYLVYRLAGVIQLIVAAAFLAAALNPAVGAIQRRRVPRLAAIALVLIALTIVVLVIGALALPSLLGQMGGLVRLLSHPGGLSNEVIKVASSFGLGGVAQALRPQLDALPAQFAGAIGSFTSVTASVLNVVTALVTVLVLQIFFLADGSRMVAWALNLVPESFRPRARRLVDESGRAVSGYVSGNLFISFIAGTGAFIGMTLLGVPYALALALLLALFDLIPMVGATLGAIPPILAAFAVSPIKAVILLAYIIVYQQIESQVLNPLVYGRSVHLPGLTVFLSVLIGGALYGFVGALIAIPVAEIISLIIREFVTSRHAAAEGASTARNGLTSDANQTPGLQVRAR